MSKFKLLRLTGTSPPTFHSPSPPPHFPQYANLHGYTFNKHPSVFEDHFGGDLDDPALDHPPPGENYYSFQMGRPRPAHAQGHSRPNPVPPRVQYTLVIIRFAVKQR